MYYKFKVKLKELNILSNILFILLLVITYLLFPKIIILGFVQLGKINNIFLLFLIMFIYLALHEVFHSLAYMFFGANFKNVTYGVKLEKGIFYCLCKQDITRKCVLNSLMYPLFYLGIVTYIMSLVINSPLLMFLSITNISGCMADIMYFIFIIKLDKNIKFTEMDDGVSFAILSYKDITNVKYYGLEYIGKSKTIERNDFKKIRISKLSYLVFLIFITLTILFGLL